MTMTDTADNSKKTGTGPFGLTEDDRKAIAAASRDAARRMRTFGLARKPVPPVHPDIEECRDTEEG